MDKIKELEERIFMLQMVDRWTSEDRNLYHKYTSELNELKRTCNRNPKTTKPHKTVTINGKTFIELTEEDIPH